MPSTYTGAGIELIGDGEQSGTWGSTTNANLQIIDRITSQAGAISLSGTSHTLTISDGTLSDGQYAVLVFGGSPSGTNTVTISPNDAKRVFLVKNDSGQSVVLTQGSGGNVTVADGKTAIVYCDGAGSGAAVVDLTADLAVTALTLADFGITASAAELNILDGATLDTAELNILDGVTATTAELNILDGVTATFSEINLLDGVTWTLADYNSLTATATELNLLDGVTGTLVTEAGTQTLTNKTLTTPAINAGSDATGDIYYRTAGGVFQRLGIGSTDQVLTVASGLPSWADASGGGLTLLETVEPTSDVSSITYATTTFTSYERVVATIICQGSSTPTDMGLQVEQAGSWRTVAEYSQTFSSNVVVIRGDILNVSNADGTGVVQSLSSGSFGNTGFDRSNANANLAEQQLDPMGGYSSYGGAITGVRWTATGGNFEGSSANNRAIAKLYSG